MNGTEPRHRLRGRTHQDYAVGSLRITVETADLQKEGAPAWGATRSPRGRRGTGPVALRPLLRYWTRSAKPDAYTVLAAAGYRDEWWIEVDQAIEALPRLRRKLKTSVDHANTGGIGPAGVPPAC